MNTPRCLLGGALLFWGWETGLLPLALLMAAALEASSFVKARWEFDNSDLNRICDLCLVLILSAGTLLFSTEERVMFVFKFAQWLPFCFFPIALAQTYGDRPSIPLSSFSWLLRRIPHSPLSRASYNVSYAYFGICVLAASASTRPNGFFYAGVSILILLALAAVRPKRVSWPVWIGLAGAVLMGGHFSHQQLQRLQNRLETALGGWIAEFFRSSADARECRTLIGHVGGIKLSGKIVLRVRVPEGDVPPGLLREGAYDSYHKGTWLSGSNEFAQVRTLNSNGSAWLLPPKKIFSRVEIAGYYTDGAGPLPLPHGTFEIDSFVGVLLTNRLGAATVQAGPGLLDFGADYWIGPSMDSPPDARDLDVPEDETNALQEAADELKLNQMKDDRQKIRAVSRFFHDHFHYSLYTRAHFGRLKPNMPPRSALGQFLLETRAGHCEYFATATVLLLRQAGVRARYITGFAVPENARHGDTYLVRERHRHAWALVYHSDTHTWEQVDNTPSSWTESAEAGTPWWEPASDFLSNVYYEFSKWRWGKTSLSRYTRWALAPLILYLLWRILSTRRRQQTPAAINGPPATVWPGWDSELYLINQRLAGNQLARQPNEPLSRWQERLEEAFPAAPALRGLFHLHRRLRFDPRGLESHDRETLRRQAGQWLAEIPAHLALSHSQEDFGPQPRD